TAAGAWRIVCLREQPDALPQVIEAFGRLAERGEREVHPRAVMREESLIAERERIDPKAAELADLRGVARGLRHLHAVGEQMLSVHPRADDTVAQRSFGLCDLVLVVREDVVDAAGVQIETLAEVARAHRRTLDVPTRIAVTPRRRPHQRGTAGLGVLPEREVGRVV